MNIDEQAIRELVAIWMEATAHGDLDTVLELMDDEVVFLGPGRSPMRGKAEFAATTRAAEGKSRIEGSADVQEVRVFGDWAYCWLQLTVTMHPLDGEAAVRRAGPAMSVLRKTQTGRWVIFRDANMLAPVK
jgi:uncharacterized protein (TIGR02246 family)